MSLPSGIWDNPTPEESQIYAEFVNAWDLSDEKYQEYYAEWSADQPMVTAADYGYGDPCGHCSNGPGIPEDDLAELVFLPVVPESVEPILRGLNNHFPSNQGGETDYDDYDQYGCTNLQFGYQFPIPLVEEGALKAQTADWRLNTGWVIFANKTYSDDTSDPEYYIPIGSTVVYAFVRMWPETRIPGFVYTKPLCYSTPAGDYSMPDDFCLNPEIWTFNQTDMKKNLLGAGKQELNVDQYSPWGQWTKGVPHDSGELTCFAEWTWGTDQFSRTDPGEGVQIVEETSDNSIVMYVGPVDGLYAPDGAFAHYVTEKVELGVYFYPPSVGVVGGGEAEVNQDGIYDEQMHGGVVVGGTSPDELINNTTGGVTLSGSVPQDLGYEATGGVVVQRPDVELHLDFNIEDDSTAQDISSHERHSDLINMDSTSFTDGRITNNKYMDFEA